MSTHRARLKQCCALIKKGTRNMNEEENKEQKEEKENDLTEQSTEQNAETETLPQLVADLKEQFSKEKEDLEDNYKKQIKERDNIIKQLMSNEQPVNTKSIAEEINERRKASLKPW